MTIKINGTDISTGNFKYLLVQYDDSPPIKLITEETVRSVGEVLVGARVMPKNIKIKCLIEAPTDNLVPIMDEFKSKTFVVGAEMEIIDPRNTESRFFNVSLEGAITSQRSEHNICFVIYELNYQVLDSFGSAEDEELVSVGGSG